MSQEVMNELVNMSQEIFKLKDQRRELLEALQYAIKQVPELAGVPGIASAIAKAESAQ